MKYDPKTYIIVSEQGQKIERPTVFEPALIPQKHLRGAFRLGEPIFEDPEIRTQWLNIRRQVMDYLLQIISCSIWKDRLVLRGSLLLKAWLGDVAREPGDIDWVFRPHDISVNSPLSRELFNGLIQIVSDHPHVGNAIIDVDKISITEIWTYERASGRRIIFPWKADGFPSGDLHMDVVFNEELLCQPIQVYIPSSIAENSLVWAASKELSLAWKLLWLETDTYPQGKDLYDATLLAEQTSLSFDILYKVLHSSEDWKNQAAGQPNFSWKSGFPWTESPGSAYLDWDNFKLEYPGVEGEAKDWQARLSRALAPTFANLDD
ncbi:nucleotidyl transferase AbiEii/AbiGii toxin family protein [Microcoleus sp. AR_TQ3_B6]|uniref:nucleotidyl transferase AbiEii/AbiGii toxin family protein n=1 Tax=Microcoleus sp. AR_TQ3_B6 TaxID=3055284 RepID=UPI002FD1D99C